MTIQGWGLFLYGLAVGGMAVRAGEPPVLDDQVSFTVSVYASGLQGPDGLALHPQTHELYVSEEEAGRISVIRKGQAEAVISVGFQVHDDLPADLVDTERPREYWLRGHLASPEGITFGPDQNLYVVEDTARGRILQFDTDAKGRYTTAKVIPTPRLGEPYAWESLCFSKNGQLYLAGSSYETSRSWGYSCVLTRDQTQMWWMVDYGPLASFSALTLMEDDQILVTGDESVGGLTWWDLERKLEVQTLTHELGAIEGICSLPDGSLVVALETSATGGRIVRINPANGAMQILAEGLGTLESIVCDQRSGRLYVAEDSTGRILCLTPQGELARDAELFRVARRSSEARRGLPPTEPPPFLKEFMSRIGVDLVESAMLSGGSGEGEPAHTGSGRAMTMEELGQRIPMVAGRVQVEPMPDEADPVTEVHFLSLYPNQFSEMRGQPAPPVCLFAARRQSGQVDRSQRVGGLHVRKYSPAKGWERLSSDAQWMLPLNTCSTAETSNGVTVVMTFLGLGHFEDSVLTINYGLTNEAYFALAGEKLRVARASFMERGSDGSEVCNFALTGVRSRRVEDATWMPLGPRANWTLLSPGFDNWIPRRALATMPDLVNRLRRYDRYISDILLAELPGSPTPPMVERKPPPEGKELPAEGKTREDHVELKTKDVLPPMADLHVPSHEETDDASFTNLLLRQIVRAWNRSWEGNN